MLYQYISAEVCPNCYKWMILNAVSKISSLTWDKMGIKYILYFTHLKKNSL